MNLRQTGFRFLLLAVAALALPACSSVDASGGHHDRGWGPPAHAPAHGYHKKHHDEDGGGGVELVYDSGKGVYVVAGMRDIFFHDGRYIRFGDGYWQVSSGLHGPWRKTDHSKIPKGLKGKEKHHKHGDHDRDRGHHDDDHDDYDDDYDDDDDHDRNGRGKGKGKKKH